MIDKRERNGHDAEPEESGADVAAPVQDGSVYDLRLYTTGVTPLSTRAIANIRRLCDTHLSGRYALEIIDIVQQPERIRQDQIIAAPTLIRRMPLPIRRFIGDMSRTETLLKGLDLPSDTTPHA